MNEKYTVTFTINGEEPVTKTADNKAAFMQLIREAVAHGGAWMRSQTTYFALTNHYSPLMVGDDRVSVTAKYSRET